MDARDIVRIMWWLMQGAIIYRTDSGASFCHVSRMRPDDRGMPCVTSGTQKWNGDNPSFIAIARVMIMDDKGLCKFMTVH